MDTATRIKNSIMSMGKAIEREQARVNALSKLWKTYPPESEDWERLASEVELLIGNIGLMLAVVEQQELRLKNLISG